VDIIKDPYPTDKELEKIQHSADFLAYVLECKDAPYEEQIQLINGYEKLNDFGFHDSKPVWFEHTEQNARLKLKYDGITAVFLFEGIEYVYIDSDPLTNWIGDFYCYRYFHDRELIMFDVGFYKIVCSTISVENIERVRE
jgi:hypothetical protein